MSDLLAFHVSGIPEFDDALGEMSAAILEACRTVVRGGALLVATEAKKGFRPYPGGRTVSKNKPWNPRFQSHIGRVYYSFAPPFQAQPPVPTRRSGALQTSIGSLLEVRTSARGASAIMGTRLQYANYVEYGTSKMAKEPFMEKALNDSRERIQALAESEIAKVIE